MKLRILGNSVRLRLTQTEVRQLAEGQPIRESTIFGPDSRLTYELKITNDKDFSVHFQNGYLKIILPTSLGKPWAIGTEISLRKDWIVDDQTKLSVLIEKDFKCKTDRVGENEEDMFPNPEC